MDTALIPGFSQQGDNVGEKSVKVGSVINSDLGNYLLPVKWLTLVEILTKPLTWDSSQYLVVYVIIYIHIATVFKNRDVHQPKKIKMESLDV